MDDCLIIGGGVVGLSLAWELARSGLRVHVVERGEPGREASWAGAGILPAARRSPGGSPLDQISSLSLRLHGEWAARLRAETGIDTGFRVCGELHIARTATATEVIEKEARDFETAGLRVERPAVSEVLVREPALVGGAASKGKRDGEASPLFGAGDAEQQGADTRHSPITGSPETGSKEDRILGAYGLPDAAQIRNPRHLQALVSACQQCGVRLTTNAAVTDVEIRDRRIANVITPRGRFDAERVIICAGAWSEALLQRLGFTLPLRPIRGQMVLMKLPRQALHCIVHEGLYYLVPRDDGRVLVGSTLEDVGFDVRTTDDAIRELTSFAHAIMPALRNAEIERTWAGLRPGSDLPHPLIGRLPGYDNALIATGHFRWGLYLSTATAVLLRQVVLGEQPEIGLAAFQPGPLKM